MSYAQNKTHKMSGNKMSTTPHRTSTYALEQIMQAFLNYPRKKFKGWKTQHILFSNSTTVQHLFSGGKNPPAFYPSSRRSRKF